MKEFEVNGVKCIFNPEAEVHGDRYKAANGKRFTGVTSALQAIAKPALVDWAAKEAYKDCESGANPKKILEEKDYAHKRKSDKAKSTGTDTHSAFERWDRSDRLVAPVIEWFDENNIQVLKHELPVFHTKYWYAGTFDAVVKWGAKIYIVDWKTSSGVYGRDYFAQCAAYLKAYCETYQEEVAPGGYIVVRVDKPTVNRKGEKSYRKFNKTVNLTTRGGNLATYGNIFVVSNKDQVEKDFRYFLACLAVYRMGIVDYFDEELEPIINQYIKQDYAN